MRHNVKFGESPTSIAREYGVPFDALIRANPFKPTTVVAGRRTWVGIAPNEEIIVPVGGMVGDAASDVVSALVAAGGPCQQRNVALVCAVQRALGVTVDGKYGTNTAAAARARVPSAPAGCSPTPSWWVKGQSACPSGGSAPIPIPISIPDVVAPAAAAAAAALPNPCDPANVAFVCALQRTLGVTVDGKYGNDTATAARRLNPNAPPGCSPRPAWWRPAGQSNCAGAAPPPPPPPAQPPPHGSWEPPQAPSLPAAPPVSSVPAAAQILASINPCLQSNVEIVRAAQRTLGLNPDGKYGTDTSGAARRLVPNAPAGCSPAPLWWGAKGVPAPPGPPAPPQAVPAIVAAATTAQTAQTAAATATTPAQADVAAAIATTAIDTATVAVAQAKTPEQKAAAEVAVKVAEKALDTAEAKGGTAPSGGLVAPEKKEGLSTGAIVAGAVGLAALVGLIAVAASGKSTSRTSTTTIRRAPRRAAPKRKSAPRKKSARKKKRK